MNKMNRLFKNNPRTYAIELVQEGFVSSRHLLLALVNHMSNDDLRECLDANELSPRFDDYGNTE